MISDSQGVLKARLRSTTVYVAKIEETLTASGDRTDVSLGRDIAESDGASFRVGEKQPPATVRGDTAWLSQLGCLQAAVRPIDRKTYNPRLSGKSSNVVTIEAIAATLPHILGRADQIP